MESAGPLEDHIRCTKCEEIYRNPHTLGCLHTFCLQCINQLLQWNKVQCPECMEYSTNDVIRQDVKIQAFIDYYNNHDEDQTKDHQAAHKKCVTICEMCEATDKPIKCKCVECHQFMCSSCEITHRGMRICKNHMVRPIEDEIKAIQMKLSNTIYNLEEQKSNAEKTSAKITDAIVGIKNSQEVQLADVNRYIDYLVRDMENYRQYLQQTIQESNDNLVSGLLKSQSTIDEYQKEIQNKIGKLNEIVTSKDIGILTESSNSLDDRTREDVKHIQLVFLEEGYQVKSCINIEKGEKWDLQKSVRVTLSESQINESVHDQRKPEEPYSKIVQNSYEKKICEKLDNVPNCLCIINDELWCAAESVVYVYDKQCKRVKTIKHKNIQNVHGISQAYTDHILLACHSNKGLKILDPTGKYIGQVVAGSFSDVCSYENKIYALEYSNQKLIALSYINNKWVQETDYDLNYTGGCTVDKVCVNSCGIYISSFFNHCIYIYNPAGEFLHQRGEQGTGKAGVLQSPSLCDVDKTGNALIADQGNHILQVYIKVLDQWQEIVLPGDMKCPTHAVVDPRGDNIWVVTYNSRQLVKYIKAQY